MVALGNNSALLERFSQGIREDEIDPGANHLYSVAALTNQTGGVVERYRYDTYGNRTVLAPDGITTRTVSSYNQQVGFTGRYLDRESGMWFFRGRYYSGSLGRFVSRDPFRVGRDPYVNLDTGAVLFGLIAPFAMDGYQDGFGLYVANFAPNQMDPSGESTCCFRNIQTDYPDYTEGDCTAWVGPIQVGVLVRIPVGGRFPPAHPIDLFYWSRKCWYKKVVINAVIKKYDCTFCEKWFTGTGRRPPATAVHVSCPEKVIKGGGSDLQLLIRREKTAPPPGYALPKQSAWTADDSCSCP